MPKKIEAIVDTSGEFLGVNYGKMTAVLTKALQETLIKVEHLENRLFEVEDELKELKGKRKGETKPKAKPKAKSKSKNVD